MKLNDFLLIAIGAIPGAVLRWQINNNLIANLLGCFIIGLVCQFPNKLRFQSILALGFCGSLTTFSGLMVDVLIIILHDNIFHGIYLIFTSVVFGLLAVGLGYFIAKKLRV